jgi:hypothetical protein
VAPRECDTWSLTLNEDFRLKVFSNRNIRGPHRNEVTLGCRSYSSDVARDVPKRAAAQYKQELEYCCKGSLIY